MALPPAQPLFEAFEEGLQDYAPHLVAEGGGALFTTRLVYRSLNTVVITISRRQCPTSASLGGSSERSASGPWQVRTRYFSCLHALIAGVRAFNASPNPLT